MENNHDHNPEQIWSIIGGIAAVIIILVIALGAFLIPRLIHQGVPIESRPVSAPHTAPAPVPPPYPID